MTPTGSMTLAIAALLVVAGCGGSSSSGEADQVLGFENRCDGPIAVTADRPEAEQPTQAWLRLEPGSWKAAGNVSTDHVALFIREPDADVGQAYVVATSSLVHSVGGPLDLLVVVEGGLCP